MRTRPEEDGLHPAGESGPRLSWHRPSEGVLTLVLAGRWCLDPQEDLSPGQAEAIDRVYRLYPELADDAFVAESLERWLA